MKPTDRFQGAFLAHGDHGGGHHYTPEEMHNEDVAHEDSDISLPAIGWSAMAVVVTCVGTAVLIYGLFWGVFIKQADARDPKLSPLVLQPTEMPKTTTAAPDFGSAPEPRLLTNEPAYLKGVRDREQQTLHGYAWVDQAAGVARIPIEEAKKLTLERGLPVRPEPTTDPRLGTHVPAFGEATSGRSITQAPAAATTPAPAAAPAPAAEHKPAEHKN
jgi:hypothetical protein